MTVLSVCQEAARRIGIPVPTSIVGATSDDAITLFGLLEEVASDIVRRHDWQKLRREHTWTTTATEEQTGAFPSDFGRMIDNTAWNRDDERELIGPLTADEWQRLKATVSTAVFDQFTIRNGALYVDPVPPAGQTWAYEYITNQWWEDNGGTGQTTVQGDTDEFRLDDELLTRGLVWSYRQVKSLDYAEDFAKYEKHLANLRAQEKGGNRNLRLDGRRWIDIRFPGVATPEGNWDL